MPSSSEDDAALLRRHEPILRLTRGELFHPSAVDAYVRQAALVSGSGDREHVLARAGTLTLDRLAELGAQHSGERLSLRYVRQPVTGSEYRSWRREHAPRLPPLSRGAAAAGVLARVVPTLMRLSLLLRGNVPGGWTAAAHQQSVATPDADTCHWYGRVVRDGGYVVLQYWFFYPMNDWRSSYGGVNDHEADWEHVAVVLADEPEGPVPRWVVLATHDETGADLRRRWDDPDLQAVDGHPVVHVGAGSHSAACVPGDYLVTVAPELPAWLERVRRGVARLVPWWDPEAVGIGVPFLDVRRGNGLTIGPGHDREWQGHLVDDDTPWVRDYRGLWGLDTGDPWGGERAPAGPRYERGGRVRPAWSQPLAWAELDGEPATRREALALWHARPGHLENELSEVERDLASTRAALRAATVADRAAGRPDHRPGAERRVLHREVVALRARQARLAAELDGHASADGTVPPETGPHDHLRHRPLPLDRDTGVRAKARLVWASASSTVLFAGIGTLLVIGRIAVLLPAVGVVIGVLLVEAGLRGHLRRFLVNLLMTVAVVALGWLLIGLLVENLRMGVGALLLLAAAYMAAQTVSDAVLQRWRRGG